MATLRFSDASEVAGAGCASCGRALFGRVGACQSCKRKRMLKTGIAVFIVCEAAMAAFFTLVQPSLHQPAQTAELPPPVLPSPAPAQSASGWLYFNTQDNVVGDLTRHARLISNSPVNVGHDAKLAFQAQGTLELAASEHYGKTVTVSFPHVATACEANPCEVRAIFDQTQPMVFAYTDASSDKTTVLMLKDYDRFAQRLAVSHDLTLVASLGTAHDHILSFDVDGYRRIDTARAGRPRGAVQFAAK